MGTPTPRLHPLVPVGLFVAATALLAVGKQAEWVESSWLEIIGAVSGALCVLLVVRRHVANFPVGILSCAAYLLFFSQGRLFADAGLQVMFILLNVHGWLAWAKGPTAVVPVRRVPLGELTALAVLFPFAWLGLTELLTRVGGKAPVYDAFIATGSLTAQWLLNCRCVENWLAWIVVDVVSVWLYWTQGMHLTAGLYVLFLCMCIAGLAEWRRELTRETPA